jgi:predicted TIM-barrel fold metal-dependent hydrolase
MTLDRRTVLKSLLAGAASAGGLARARDSSGAGEPVAHFKIWDVHTHLDGVEGDTPEARMEVLVRHMDRLGIERIILSQGYDQYIRSPTTEQVREENDRVMRAVRRFPDRAYGSVYLSPTDVKFCLEEIDRCVRDGPMISVGELEADVRCNSPALDPIVERAIALKAPILQHTWIKTNGNEPRESTPYDLVELARRHPQAQFICGHTGGNWELGIRAIRDVENVCAGIAGSDPTAGFIEMAVRELGAERVVYGSDAGGRSFASQMAKVIGAEISESAKGMILGGNVRRLLRASLEAKGLKG